EDDEQWDHPQCSWGSPLPRIDAAEGLMRLAALPNRLDAAIRAAIDKLSRDPHPAVRFILLHGLVRLWNVDRDWFWRLVEFYSYQEPRMAILRAFIHQVLLELPHSESERSDAFVRTIYQRTLQNPKAIPVRQACAIHFFRRALWDGA